jgi:hypothetical protein
MKRSLLLFLLALGLVGCAHGGGAVEKTDTRSGMTDAKPVDHAKTVSAIRKRARGGSAVPESGAPVGGGESTEMPGGVFNSIAMPENNLVGQGAESPQAAVSTYLRTFSKELPVSVLDDVIDWEAVHTEMSANDESIGALSPSLLAEIFKAELDKTEAVVSKEEVDLLSQNLTVEADGSEALVHMPGADGDPFLVARKNARWRITHFPH